MQSNEKRKPLYEELWLELLDPDGIPDPWERKNGLLKSKALGFFGIDREVRLDSKKNIFVSFYIKNTFHLCLPLPPIPVSRRTELCISFGSGNHVSGIIQSGRFYVADQDPIRNFFGWSDPENFSGLGTTRISDLDHEQEPTFYGSKTVQSRVILYLICVQVVILHTVLLKESLGVDLDQLGFSFLA
jgi:hypothetical protein